MRFHATADYPATAHEVAGLFADPDFVDAKIAASRATEGSKEITGDPEGAFTVTTTRTMPPDLAPAQYRKFLPGGGVRLTLIEAWQAPDGQGNRRGELTMKIAGAPASASGQCRLENSGAGASRLTYEGEINVSIPLIGPRVEQAAVETVEQVMAAERAIAAQWLAR